MKEIIAILLILFFYLFVSYNLQKVLLRVKKVVFLMISTLYIALTYFFFELINQIEIILMAHKIYFDFGHANLLMLEAMALCFLICVVNIIFVMIKRNTGR